MKSYDPTKVSVIFNGTTITGFGPDTFVKVMRNEDGWSLQMGNSGSGARSRNPNKSGRCEVTLLTSDPSNALLMAFADTDELSGQGVGELLIKDRATALAVCSAQNAWVVKIPDWERAKEVGAVTWIIESDLMHIFHDGIIDQ